MIEPPLMPSYAEFCRAWLRVIFDTTVAIIEIVGCLFFAFHTFLRYWLCLYAMLVFAATY